jgi:hypothetical protein
MILALPHSGDDAIGVYLRSVASPKSDAGRAPVTKLDSITNNSREGK